MRREEIKKREKGSDKRIADKGQGGKVEERENEV